MEKKLAEDTESVGAVESDRDYEKNVTSSKQTVEVDDTGNDDDDGIKRPTWGRSIEFLMSCVSLSVGLGNVWRFPFTAYENGGGAFLVPYICVLVLIGKPMYFMEMVLGQFTSRGAVQIWQVAPMLKGIGIGQIVTTIFVLSYYVSLISLTMNYLFTSFSSELPWGKCNDDWEEICVDSSSSPRMARFLPRVANQSISSSELYFVKEVLKEKDDISDGIGLPDLKLTMYLLLAWVIVFLVIVKGVKSSGKVAYFLAIFPYAVMITILVRGVTLPGATDGILFFLKPQWGEILNAKVWYAATTQVFYSLSVGTGSIIMFSSYNNFNHNIYRDALIVTTLDTFTSLLAGMTIFSILGNLAFNLGVDDIGKVVKAGSSLAFISYPDAIAKFDVWPQFFAVLFFFMLTVLGIGSAVALCSAVTTVIYDEFPKIAYWKIAGCATFSGFCLGVCYITPGGQWMLNLVDHFGGTFLVFALAIVEMLAVFYVYGLDNLCDDIEFMLKWKPTAFWRISWLITTPGIMIIIFFYYMANLETPTYSGWSYPIGALSLGWCIFAFGVLQFPIWMIVYLVQKRKMLISDRLKAGTSPTVNWGPKNPNDYKAWVAHKAEAQKRRAEFKANGRLSAFWAKLTGK